MSKTMMLIPSIFSVHMGLFNSPPSSQVRHLLDKVPSRSPGAPALSTGFPKAQTFRKTPPPPPRPAAEGSPPPRGLTAGEQSQGHGDDRDDDGDPQDAQQPLHEGLQGKSRQPAVHPPTHPPAHQPPAVPNPPSWRGGPVPRGGRQERGAAGGSARLPLASGAFP